MDHIDGSSQYKYSLSIFALGLGIDCFEKHLPTSRKKKMIFQVGNKILLNYKSKNQNKVGYFSTELIEPISAKYFDDTKKSISILSAASILKILLPEGEANKHVYPLFAHLLNQLHLTTWIKFYIYW